MKWNVLSSLNRKKKFKLCLNCMECAYFHGGLNRMCIKQGWRGKVRGMEQEGDMASQDQNFKYIGSLTEGPSLTSGCGMACCPWTAYACKERQALRRVWQSHTQARTLTCAHTVCIE